MYNVLQLSLKEYEIRNNSSIETIYITVDEFIKDEYKEVVEVVKIEPDGIYFLNLPNDGIFRLVITLRAGIGTPSDPYTIIQTLATITIHNITDLLEKKQRYLTQVLLRPNLHKCDHNQYYDIISFSIIFDTYIKLVKDTFVQSNVSSEQLYKIYYLFSKLKTF